MRVLAVMHNVIEGWAETAAGESAAYPANQARDQRASRCFRDIRTAYVCVSGMRLGGEVWLRVLFVLTVAVVAVWCVDSYFVKGTGVELHCNVAFATLPPTVHICGPQSIGVREARYQPRTAPAVSRRAGRRRNGHVRWG